MNFSVRKILFYERSKKARVSLVVRPTRENVIFNGHELKKINLPYQINIPSVSFRPKFVLAENNNAMASSYCHTVN